MPFASKQYTDRVYKTLYCEYKKFVASEFKEKGRLRCPGHFLTCGDTNNYPNTNLVPLDSSSFSHAQALPRWFLDLLDRIAGNGLMFPAMSVWLQWPFAYTVLESSFPASQPGRGDLGFRVACFRPNKMLRRSLWRLR